MRFLILLLLPAACLVAGCQSLLLFGGTPTPTATPLPTPTRADEVVIPFETIAVNDMQFDLPKSIGEPAIQSEYGALEGNGSLEPTAFLITSSAELSALAEWLPPETITTTTAIDFEHNVVLVFSGGLMGGGSDAYVERIAASGPTQLRVYGVERHASAGTTNETLPSHVMCIRKQDLPYTLSPEVRIAVEMRVELIEPFVLE